MVCNHNLCTMLFYPFYIFTCMLNEFTFPNCF